MAFITQSNSKRILRKINLSDIAEIEGNVYKKPIYFLSKSEKKYLMLMQTLLKEPEKFAIEVYTPVINKDTFKYVYESEQPPSYHTKKECDRLNATFKNFEIPSEIEERAINKGEKENKTKEEIDTIVKQDKIKFRSWFKSNFQLFQDDTEGFLKKLDIRWNIQRQVNEVEKDNSGIEFIKNLNLAELEQEIDKIISQAGFFFTSNKDKQQIIRRFQKLTFLAYRDDEIYNNDTELTDSELKKFLLYYDTEFKKPVKNLLLEYYRVKYNPDLSFDGNLLEKLNFRPCSVCEGNTNIDYVIEATLADENKEEEIDDLPF